jgi:hypothetical protein
MQQTYHLIGEAITAFSVLVLIFFACIEFQALRRYGHKSFLLLLIGSLFSLASAFMGMASYLVHSELPTMLHSLEVRCLFYVPGAIFSLWGTLSLFRSYGALFKTSHQPDAFG